MTVQEALDQLALSELSNTILSQDRRIIKQHIPYMVKLFNDGLDKLFIKFNLKAENIFVELIDGKQRYEISSDHMMEPDLEPDWEHYLWKGYQQTYEDDLIKILYINTTDGRPIPINHHLLPDSVYTPKFNEILVPFNFPWMEFNVTYQARHKRLSPEKLDEVIDMAPQLFPALFNWVAYQVHSNINTAEAVQNAAKYQTQYQNAINEMVETGSADSLQAQDSWRFISRGWV